MKLHIIPGLTADMHHDQIMFKTYNQSKCFEIDNMDNI